MSAYIEYVIADNLVITYLLSALTYRIALQKKSPPRSIIAAAVGTAVALSYPFITGDAALYAVRAGLFVVLSAVQFAGRKKPIMCSLIFLLLTFAFGGAVLALAFLARGDIHSAMRTGPGEFPLFPLPLGVALTYVIIKKLSVRLHKNKDISDMIYGFSLTLLGERFDFRGLMDTGNRLYDERTGLPVIMLRAKSLVGRLDDESFEAMFLGRGDTLQRGAHYITINTAGGGSRRILLLRADGFILYSHGKENILNDVMVGITFAPLRDVEDYDAILHPALF